MWLKDGTEISVRSIRPEDEGALARFHKGLSDHSVHERYFQWLSLARRTSAERLHERCTVDPDRETALVVERVGPDPPGEILGVGRLCLLGGGCQAEFALIVSDAWHRRGLGTILLTALLRDADARGVRRVVAYVMPDNAPMLRLCRAMGFEYRYDCREEAIFAWRAMEAEQPSRL